MYSIDINGLEGDDDDMFGGLLEDTEKSEVKPVEKEKLARAGQSLKSMLVKNNKLRQSSVVSPI